MHPSFDTVARKASTQHGRISHAQILEAGGDRDRIKRWSSGGLLRRVHRGVYAVGHKAPSVHAAYMAAVLACGQGAVLSHRAAAWLLGLIRGPAPAPEVTVPTTAGRRRPGIAIHRVAAIHERDVTTVDGMAVTTISRSLLDLATREPPEVLTRLCHEAWVRHGTTPGQVEACIARNPHKNGAPRLRRAQRADVTLSELERRFLMLLRAHDLPKPRTNVDRLGDKVDCHWRDRGLTVELHSYRFHATRQAFETDLARRRRSRHIAYSYGDVFERAEQTAAEVAALLSATAPRG